MPRLCSAAAAWAAFSRLLTEVCAVAEAEGHHPDLLLTYSSLTIWLWTHAAGGLTDNDFILAARLNEAVSQSLN